jgi:hypothetical protein
MSYSTERAALIATQLERLATQNAYQLAGQFPNLDFWIDEAATALRVIDGYPERFRRLRDAQVEWVKAHDTKVSDYCPICSGACEIGPETPAPPQRTPSDDLHRARESIRTAARRYFLRLYRAHLIEEDAVRRACDAIGTGVESEDLVRAEPPPNLDEGPRPRHQAPDPNRKR